MDYKEYKAGQALSNFWFRGKDDLIFLMLSQIPKKKCKILSLGAGTGDDLDVLNKFGDVYVVDIDPEVLNLINESDCYEKKVSDARDLDYPDNFFDVVTSFDLFEHITEDALAVSEVKRVLKKGGHLIFTVPAFQSLFSSHDKALEHKRRYSKKKLQNLFSLFKTVDLNYWNSTLFIPSAVFRFCKKKSPPQVDIPKISPLVNEIFYKILKAENFLIGKKIKLPFGLSLIGTCKK